MGTPKGLRQKDLKFEASLEYVARLCPARTNKIKVGARVKAGSQSQQIVSSSLCLPASAHQRTLQGDPVSVATSQQPPCTMTSSWCTTTAPSWSPAWAHVCSGPTWTPCSNTPCLKSASVSSKPSSLRCVDGLYGVEAGGLSCDVNCPPASDLPTWHS